jgi:hypothetical protein
MTIINNNNSDKENSMGFKGFDILETEIDESSIMQKKDSSGLSAPEKRESSPPQQSIDTSSTGQELFQLNTPKKSYEWGNIIFALLAGLFVSYLIYVNYISPPQNNYTHTSSNNTSSDSYSSNNTNSPKNSYITEIRPAHSTNPIYNAGNIYYCLAEKIRLEASKSRVDSTDNNHIDKYNQYVNDYNYLCGSYRYKQRDYDAASRTVEEHKYDLSEQGYNRFQRYDDSR